MGVAGMPNGNAEHMSLSQALERVVQRSQQAFLAQFQLLRVEAEEDINRTLEGASLMFAGLSVLACAWIALGGVGGPWAGGADVAGGGRGVGGKHQGGAGCWFDVEEHPYAGANPFDAARCGADGRGTRRRRWSARSFDPRAARAGEAG